MSRHESFSKLVDTMHRLRSPGGCPWDAEQTHSSLRQYLLEEAYEVVDAIESGVDDELREELGDLLLQVVFHAELATERRAFGIDEIAETVNAKLIRRHPHVFADASVDSSEDVAANWSKIKAAERAEKAGGGRRPSSLDGVPSGLPALLRAHRLGERASEIGLDWKTPSGARSKVDEELSELDEAVISGNDERIAHEIGDVLFSLASYARLLGQNAETALRAGLSRFDARVRKVEAEFDAAGSDPAEATAEDLDAAWQRAKLDEPAGD